MVERDGAERGEAGSELSVGAVSSPYIIIETWESKSPKLLLYAAFGWYGKPCGTS